MDATRVNIPQNEGTEGVLIVHKEAGWTSHDVVAKVRRLLGTQKVGHAGTLDPAATGVLPILIGRATRIAEYLIDWDKEYRAVLRLGETTDTQDASGRVLSAIDPSHITEEALRAAVAKFRGAQKQLPPMYSAVKVGGKPLYKAARAGQTIDRAERTISIYHLDIVARNGRDVTLQVVCSKGTYIRTLCADIGQTLGVGGHLLTLERRRVGPLPLEQALTIDEVTRRLHEGTLQRSLLSLDQLLEQLPALVVTNEQVPHVLHGAPVLPAGIGQLPSSSELVSVRLKTETGRLLAIGTHDPRNVGPIKIRKVLSVSNQ